MGERRPPALPEPSSSWTVDDGGVWRAGERRPARKPDDVRLCLRCGMPFVAVKGRRRLCRSKACNRRRHRRTAEALDTRPGS